MIGSGLVVLREAVDVRGEGAVEKVSSESDHAVSDLAVSDLDSEEKRPSVSAEGILSVHRVGKDVGTRVGVGVRVESHILAGLSEFDQR